MATTNNIDNLGSGLSDFTLKELTANFTLMMILKMQITYNNIYVQSLSVCNCSDRPSDQFQEKFKNKKVLLAGINSNDPVSYPETLLKTWNCFLQSLKWIFLICLTRHRGCQKISGRYALPIFLFMIKKSFLKYRGRFDDNWKMKSRWKKEISKRQQ